MLRHRLPALTALGALLTLTLIRLGHAAPSSEHGWSMPHDDSVHGHRLDWLLHITFVFIGILFLVMCGWMLIACVRHGRKHSAKYDHGDKRRSMLAPLGMAAIVFVVVDGNLFFHSTKDMHSIFWNFAHAESAPNAVRIEVNAHQWAWDARYAGPDGKWNTQDDVVTLNDIRVPVGAPVIFQLGAVDVLHSFYLPNFRVKMDVVPGNITRAWLQAREVGEFEIGCAQHCGTNHYKMRGLLTVLPPAEYERWLADASRDSAQRWRAEDTAAHWGWPWQKGARK